MGEEKVVEKVEERATTEEMNEYKAVQDGLSQAVEAVQGSQQALLKTQGVHDYLRQKMMTKYQIGPKDKIMDDGLIVRGEVDGDTVQTVG